MALDLEDYAEIENDFDAQYGDELDLLAEAAHDEDVDFETSRPKSRRSLHFTSPVKNTGAHRDNESPIHGVRADADPTDRVTVDGVTDPLPCSDAVQYPRTSATAKRKSREHVSPTSSSSSPAGIGVIKPPEKRARLETQHSFDDDDDLDIPMAPSLARPQGTRAHILPHIPDGDFVSVTGIYGNRFYMSVMDDELLTKQVEATSHQRQPSSLLSLPYYQLKQRVLQEKDDAIQGQSERIRSLLTSLEDEDIPDASDVREISEPRTESNLWVEKYSPLKYTELLSDETVNRSLLQWIKLWDHVVFRKDLPIKPKEQKNKENKKFVKKNDIEILTELDKFKRPIQKIVILCGPPGLGKTTLAHIIARHAGYKVIEMNASDDRSAEAFTSTVESCTQMKSVLGADPRPNCLVIDEIDGAPVAAINVLLSLIKYPDGATKRKKNSQILLRPIICICNDLYVPALRELRKVALVLTFPRTAAPRLATRLYEVVGEESMKADMNSLLALCEKTDNDIRACLNTLQFLRRTHAEITLRMVHQMNIGQKDSHKNLFAVWHDIFTIPRPKRFEHILAVVHAAGDYNKLNQGLYENYLEAKSKDPHLTGLVLSTDWLCFIDHINQYIARTQDYSPMKYIPYMAVTFHLIYGATTYPKIQYPHTEFEHTKKLAKSSSLIAGLVSDMLPSVRIYFDSPAIIMDLLPSLLHIIQPTLRPVNTQLYSSREKSDLLHLVCVMIAYNLGYKQEKQVDMQYNYVLDPNVDELVRFEGNTATSRKPLTYAAKQLVAREVELEKMRRSEVAYGTVEKENGSKKQPAPRSAPTPAEPAPSSTRSPLMDGIRENKPVRNFFGQIIKKDSSKITKEGNKKGNLLSTNVWFHFKEGFSNAVRRNVRVKDFL